MNTSSLYDEKKNFILFLIFVVLTSFLILYQNSSDVVLGALGIFWGLYGFFRLVYLNQTPSADYPGVLTLPARLIFGLAQEKQAHIQSINNRLGRFDVIAFIILGLSYIVWALYCSYFPSEIHLVQNLKEQQELVLEFPLRQNFHPHAIMSTLSFYGIIGIIILSAFSYAGHKAFSKLACSALFLVFLTGVTFNFLNNAIANPVLLPDPDKIIGSGLGQADILRILLEGLFANSGTMLFERAVEVGIIGAYGLYFVLFPVALVLSNALRLKGQRVNAALALLAIILLLGSDVLSLQNPLQDSLVVIIMPFIALCWANSLSFRLFK